MSRSVEAVGNSKGKCQKVKNNTNKMILIATEVGTPSKEIYDSFNAYKISKHPFFTKKCEKRGFLPAFNIGFRTMKYMILEKKILIFDTIWLK